MPDFDDIDFFRGTELIPDPYPYFTALRDRCPVQREERHGVVMVTGYEEACQVYRDPVTFSSCNSVTGPFPGFPVPLEGDDISALIEAYRDELPMSDQLPTFDPPKHTDHRALLMRLLTPKRLKENEDFMWRNADRQLDEFLARGECELMGDFAGPFTLLVIADLLGVPESDHADFREELQGSRHADRGLGSTADESLQHSPLEFLYSRFSAYIEERRRSPRDDVLTRLATTTFPDGTMPEVVDAVRVAANLFAAGQETTVRLLGTAFQVIGEDVALQQVLRADHELIPGFIEECLRIESPVKGDFRLSRVPTTIGQVAIPAGTTVMVLNAAANRDPQHFEAPDEFRHNRANAREHLSFGRGIHACPGASLARAEAAVAVERFLARAADIRISEDRHGPRDQRRYRYLPTYILRGLTKLHLEFTALP